MFETLNNFKQNCYPKEFVRGEGSLPVSPYVHAPPPTVGKNGVKGHIVSKRGDKSNKISRCVSVFRLNLL